MVIVNMDIPESCHKCCCYDVDYQRCVISSIGIPNRYNYDGSIRPEWCPIKCDIDIIKHDINKSLNDPYNYIIKQDAYLEAIDIIEGHIGEKDGD